MVIFAFWAYYTMKEFKSPVKSFKSSLAKVQNIHERSKLTYLESRKQDSVVRGSTGTLTFCKLFCSLVHYKEGSRRERKRLARDYLSFSS